MREIYFNSDITPKSINEIKLLALYYDKINIVNDEVYSPKFDTLDGDFKFTEVEDLQFIPNTFRTDYKLLIDENLIAITEKNRKLENENLFASEISKIVNANHDFIFPKHPTQKDGRIITEEVYDVMKNMWGFEWGKPIERNLIWWYYSIKLQWFLKLLLDGENCLSSSQNLNKLFSAFIKEHTGTNNNLGTKGLTNL